MKKESKVMRLSEKEEELIKFIRNIKSENIALEIENVLENLRDRRSYSNLKTISNILKDKDEKNIGYFINSEIISQNDFDYLVDNIKENKSIIITGAPGIGKNLLLKLLLLSEKSSRFLIVDKYKEIDLNFTKINPNIVSIKTENLSVKDFAIASLKQKVSKVVVSETSNLEDCLGVLSSLSMGYSIITTMQSNNWKEDFLEILGDELKDGAKDILNKNMFIEVHLERKEIDGINKTFITINESK